MNKLYNPIYYISLLLIIVVVIPLKLLFEGLDNALEDLLGEKK